MPDATRRERAGQLLNALRAAQEGGDGEASWQALFGLLELMHSLDEQAKSTFPKDQDYYKRRAARADGQALGALTWFRDAVHHGGVEPQEMGLVERKIHIWTGTELKPRKVEMWTGTELKPVKMWGVVQRWPAASAIPPSKYPAHDRDIWYANLVESADLFGPIQMALAFLDDVAK
jgi:hypothetical protein